MNHQQHIDKIQLLIDGRKDGSMTIPALENVKRHIRLDQLATKSGAPKPRYRVPARKRMN